MRGIHTAQRANLASQNKWSKSWNPKKKYPSPQLHPRQRPVVAAMNVAVDAAGIAAEGADGYSPCLSSGSSLFSPIPHITDGPGIVLPVTNGAHHTCVSTVATRRAWPAGWSTV